MQPGVGFGTFSKCFGPPVYRHHGALTELAIRVGPRVRIRLAPAASLSQRGPPWLHAKRAALWRQFAGGSGREKGRAGCEPGLLRSFSLTDIDAVPPPESLTVGKRP